MEIDAKTVPPPQVATRQPLHHSRKRHTTEGIVHGLLMACGLVSIATTFGIVLSLIVDAFAFVREVPLTEFLFGTVWAPLFNPPSYGVLPLVNGTLLVAFWAMVVALPIGLLSAIYLSEFATRRTREMVKPILEILAGIPTVVYGYFALNMITPIVRTVFPDAGVFNALSASIAMGIMIIPLVASLSEDALTAVPRGLREAGFAMGATKLEVSLQIVVPGALSGIVAAFILAVSRAIGETMIAAIAAGATARMTLNPLESIETMAAYIARVSQGDTPQGSIEFYTIFAVGSLLFVITFILNYLSQRVVRRFREEYE